MGRQTSFETDRGIGKIRCLVCGEATREHPLRPCPTLELEIIYGEDLVPAPPGQGGRKKLHAANY